MLQLWRREQALAEVSAAMFLDLPSNAESAAQVDPSTRHISFKQHLQGQILNLKVSYLTHLQSLLGVLSAWYSFGNVSSPAPLFSRLSASEAAYMTPRHIGEDTSARGWHRHLDTYTPAYACTFIYKLAWCCCTADNVSAFGTSRGNY